jgi:polyhydroxybutyrate depolymerase
MRRTLIPVGFMLILVLFIGVQSLHAQDAPAPITRTEALTFDGHARTYTLTVPSSYDDTQPVPLVIALHTFASSGKAMQALTGLDDLAEHDGFIVVYPDSFDLNWNDGTVTGVEADHPSFLQYTDDVGFIGALIDHLSESYAIDPAQVYLTGFGHGGAMAHRLACEIPDRLAKVAVVGELLWDYHVTACPDPTDPVSILMLWGEADDYYYPVAGDLKLTTELAQEIDPLSLDDAAAFWARRDGCDLDSAITPDDDRKFTVYDSCDAGVSVAAYTLAGVGHNWLRTGDYTLNQYQFDTSQLVIEYFMDERMGIEDWAALLAAPGPVQEIYTGTPRSYIVYVPTTYDPDEPAPFVYALHGRPHNGAGFAYLFDFNRVAEENGFIAVYPDGVNEEWNYNLDLVPGLEDAHVNDVEFLDVLIDDLALDLNIDRTRLYVTGFSNGGFMTQRLACTPDHPFAAFAIVGATITPEIARICDDAPLRPIMLIHGTHDASVPWDGFVSNGYVVSESVPDTIRFWGIRNQCDPQQITYRLLPLTQDSATTVVFDYTIGGCAAAMRYYVIENGGHNLPGVPNRLSERIAGEVNQDMHAGTAIWAFLSQFRRN